VASHGNGQACLGGRCPACSAMPIAGGMSALHPFTMIPTCWRFRQASAAIPGAAVLL
jgi:hypothetical protein